MRNFLRALAPAVVSLVTLPALAQYSIAKIEIHGAAPYTDAEVLAVAGLQPGQLLAHDSLGNAAQHLLDTGLFDDTQVSLPGAGLRRSVLFELKPKPAAQLLPGSFANFVWFTPAELDAALRAKVPLYRGLFSDAGNFPDTVQAALQQILAAKGITATVSHEIVEPSSDHPQRIVNFRINEPAIQLATVHLTNWPPELTSQLARALNHTVNRSYNEGAGATTAEVLLAPLLDAGYLAAKLDNLQRTPSAGADGINVTLTATVNAGAIYKVSAFTSDAPPSDNSAQQARRARFEAAMRSSHGSARLPEIPTTMHAGDVASDSVLQAIMGGIVYNLKARGYLDAYVVPTPTLDNTAHTVAYALHAVPGEQYHLKSVTPLNLSPAALAEFNSTWTLKPGDIYSVDYVTNFIGDNPSLKQLASYGAGFQTSADPQTHFVDLTITFRPMDR